MSETEKSEMKTLKVLKTQLNLHFAHKCCWQQFERYYEMIYALK